MRRRQKGERHREHLMAFVRAVKAPGPPAASTPRCPVTGKITYASQGAAERRIAKLVLGSSPNVDAFRAYPCPYGECGGWHLTSQVRRDYGT